MCFLCQMGGRHERTDDREKIHGRSEENGRSCTEVCKSRFRWCARPTGAFADGKNGIVEFKAPGKKMRPLQIRRKKQLESLGFKVYCVDSVEQIGGVTRAIQSS